MKYNYIPFDLEALDRDTLLLSEDEFAVYMRLIIQYYKHDGELPNDDTKLAKLTRTNIRKFRKVWKTISSYFVFDNGNVRHLKCESTLERLRLKSETNRAKSLKYHDSKKPIGKLKDKDKDKEKKEKDKKEKDLFSEEGEPSPPPPKKSLFMKEKPIKLEEGWHKSPLPPANVIEMWNDFIVGKNNTQAHIRLTPDRKKIILVRSMEELVTGQDWYDYFDKISKDDFCMGNNDRGWKATIDWALRPKSVIKMLEGGYVNA